MIRFILSILFILSFVFSSYAYDINDYKKSAAACAKEVQKKFEYGKISLKYNIFDINGTNYAAFYILSGTDVAVGMCHAENNGVLSNCQFTNLYGFNYNKMPLENFTFSKKASSFFKFSMKTKKRHDPYILTVMENKKDKKFYFHSFSAIEPVYHWESKSYIEGIKPTIYSSDEFQRKFTLLLEDITPFHLFPQKLSNYLEYKYKSFPKSAPYVFEAIYKYAGDNLHLTIETHNNTAAMYIGSIYSEYQIDGIYDDSKFESLTLYICDKDFKKCISDDLKKYLLLESVSIDIYDDSIIFSGSVYEPPYDFIYENGVAKEHEYIGIKAKIIFNLVDEKYYLHQIIEEYPLLYDERAMQQEFETKIVYDSNGDYNIPFGITNK